MFDVVDDDDDSIDATTTTTLARRQPIFFFVACDPKTNIFTNRMSVASCAGKRVFGTCSLSSFKLPPAQVQQTGENKTANAGCENATTSPTNKVLQP
jgi:hypothetical protein